MRPVISSFLIPWKVYDEVAKNALMDSEKGSEGYKNVDPSRAPDQYGIRKAREFIDAIVPGTLVTYVDDSFTRTKPK